MLFILIITFSIAIIIFLYNKNNKVYWWYSGFIWATGLGSFAAIIQEQAIAYIPAKYTSSLMIAARILSFISYCFSPYCILVFSVLNGGFLFPRRQKTAPIYCLTPIFITLTVDFVNIKQSILYKFLDYHPLFWITTLWTTVFIFISDYYLVMGYLMEKNPQIKHQKLILLIFTIPIITYGTYTSYISVILGNYLWRYNFYLGIFVMAGFLFVTIKYGTLGVKINIEESNLNKTMKLISSGTSLLGHSIKNEVARINFSTYFLKQDLSYEDKKKYIEVIVNSTNHLNDLTARIQKNTNDIILVCELSSIRDIIEDSVNTMKLTIGERNIQIIEKYRVGPVIKIDKVHIAEVLNNIIQNAVESIPVNREGKIFIELYKSTKYAMIKINDNGTGISKENLPHVIKPFFSTKKLSTQNYGLGLSYCYNVMLAHKGFLEIKSQAAMGTSVYLSFLL